MIPPIATGCPDARRIPSAWLAAPCKGSGNGVFSARLTGRSNCGREINLRKDVSIATQTDSQRKAAAQKAAATRKQNAARRSRSARKAAETRARGQAGRLKSFGWQAQRVADTAVGVAVTFGEKVAGAAKPLQSQAAVSRQVSHLQRRAATNLRKAERRGANARRSIVRTLRRQRDQELRRLKRNRSKTERQVKSAQDELERRVEHAQAAADELAGRVRFDAKSG